ASGETAPLLFTALFSNFWIVQDGPPTVMAPTASLAVLIYNFSGMPFENQIELAWAAALVLVLLALAINITGQLISRGRVGPERSRVMPASSPLANGQTTTQGNDISKVIIDCKIDNLYYGKFLAVRDSHIPIEKGNITAFIGPSGCGKSTALRCLNRMNDLVRGFRFEVHVPFHGLDIYPCNMARGAVRLYIGMW